MHSSSKDITVAIISHNYGEFLPLAIQSVLEQSVLPAEIIIIDDSSTDTTAEIAAKYRDRGVAYQQVNFQSPLLSRRYASEHSLSKYICCLDADDHLAPDYLEEGLKIFEQNQNIGIVYSDVHFFGNKKKKSKYPKSSLKCDISIRNYIHAGAIVRRDAIEVSKAFYNTGPHNRHEDWSAWRRIISMGFIAVKQPSIYHYRKHEKGISANRHVGINGYTYFTSAALSEEEITLFTPLAGRMSIWNEYRLFLENQTWDHKKIHLILMDTSGDEVFARTVKEWLITCDYASFQYLPYNTGQKNLADEIRIDQNGQDRSDILKDVRLVMSRIYNRVKNLIASDYLWIIEDDVIPPLDVCEKLLRSFCDHTVSVSAPFLHRYEKAYAAWDKNNVPLTGGEGVQLIGGNGFGCVLMRSKIYKKHVFTSTEEHVDFDKGFYARFDDSHYVKIDWDLICQHLSPMYAEARDSIAYPSEPIPESNFDELYYLKCNPDVEKAVRSGFYKSGFVHYIENGFKENRSAKTLKP
jgi:glycosyltransferase involved in cell wall biosynthesis